MKTVKVEDAVGMILAHDLTKIVPGEFKGAAYKKGHVICLEDIEALKNMGKNHINIIEMNGDAIHEDEAAHRISRAIAGENIEFTQPSEGKIELRSAVRGIVKINVEALNRVNSIEEVIVATLHNNTLVRRNQSVAATRVIPLVIQEEKIDRVEELGREYGPIISVKEIMLQRIGMVIIGTEVYEGRIQDKFLPVFKEKMEGYGCPIISIEYAPDDLEKIENSIWKVIKEGADVVLCCGGMSVDADDMTPRAIKNVCHRVISYGIPAIPGNMLMLGYHGSTAIFGVPAAAMFFRNTSLDLLLPRIMAGEELTRDDLVAYGHGGLCLQCKNCIFPNCHFGK